MARTKQIDFTPIVDEVFEFEFSEQRDVDYFVKERTYRIYLTEVLDEMTNEQIEDWLDGEFDAEGLAEKMAARQYQDEMGGW